MTNEELSEGGHKEVERVVDEALAASAASNGVRRPAPTLGPDDQVDLKVELIRLQGVVGALRYFTMNFLVGQIVDSPDPGATAAELQKDVQINVAPWIEKAKGAEDGEALVLVAKTEALIDLVDETLRRAAALTSASGRPN